MIDFPADFTKFSKFYGLKVCFLPKFLSPQFYSKWEYGQSVSSTTAMVFPQTSASRTEKTMWLATEETDVMVEVTRQWLPRLSSPVPL